MKVRILETVTGVLDYGDGSFELPERGEVVTVPDDLGKQLVEMGNAEAASEPDSTKSDRPVTKASGASKK